MLLLRVRHIIRRTPRSVTLEMEPMNGTLSYRPGQFITLLFEDLGSRPFRRSYSFSSTPGVNAYPAITVKRTVNGQASRYLTEQVQVGDSLQALEPAGRFVLPSASGARDLFFIGGGSGITPLFSLIKHALHFEPEARVILILANSNSRSIIFREELGRLATQFPERFRCIHLLSLSDAAAEKAISPPAILQPGRLSNALVEDWVKKYSTHDPATARFFLCGPEGLMLKSRQALRFMGYEDEQIHREHFVVKSTFRPPAELFPTATVDIEYGTEVFHLEVTPGQTILEATMNRGIDLPYSCRTGVCSACAGTCLEGEVHMHTQTGMLTTKTSKGLVLTCTGYPVTDFVRIRIG